MRAIISFFLLLLITEMHAQQYAHIKSTTEAINKPGVYISPGARLKLLKKNDTSYVIYFRDTLSIEANSYELIELQKFPISTDSIVRLKDNDSIQLSVAPLRRMGYTKPVVFKDNVSNTLFEFRKDTGLAISIENFPEELRMSADDYPDAFFYKEQFRKKEPPQVADTTGSAGNGTTTTTTTDDQEIDWLLTSLLIASILLALLVFIFFIMKKRKKKKQEEKISQKSNERGQSIFAQSPSENTKPATEPQVAEKPPGEKTFFSKLFNRSSIESRLASLEAKIDQHFQQDDNGKKDLTELQAYKIKTEQDIKEQNAVIEDLRRKNDSGMLQINELRKEKEFYTSRVTKLTELQQTGNNYCRLIDFLQVVNRDAMAFCNEFAASGNSNNAYVINYIINKYNSSLPLLAIGKWHQVCTNLQDNGIITEKELVRVYKQQMSTEDKLKQLQRNIYKELFEEYINASLILCEELANLERFGVSDDMLVNRARQQFRNFSEQILKHSRQYADLDINYLPLFSNYEAFTQFVKVVNDAPGLIYRNIGPIERNHVVEVKFYGFKRIHDFESYETKVIIQK